MISFTIHVKPSISEGQIQVVFRGETSTFSYGGNFSFEDCMVVVKDFIISELKRFLAKIIEAADEKP